MNRNIIRMLVAVLITLILPCSGLALAPPQSLTVTVDEQSVGNGDTIKVDGDTEIVVQIVKPGETGTIDNYIYVWNGSSAAAGLSLSSDSVEVASEGDTFVTFDYPDLAPEGSDFDQPWYIHVRTVGGIGEPPEISDTEIMAGPFYFDSKGPSPTYIGLTEKGDQQPSSNLVFSSNVELEISATLDVKYVYLSTSPTRLPTTYKEEVSVASMEDFPYILQEFDIGSPDENDKAIIYVWYEDGVGNVTSGSIELTLKEGKRMEPEGKQTLGIDNTLEFSVVGAGDEIYIWSVVDADDPAQVSTAGSLSVSNGVATLTGISEGTIRVKALPGSGEPIYSGVITIVQMFCLDVDGDGTQLAFTDGLLILRYLMGTFQGDALTNGAAQPGGNRIDPDEVKAYLDFAKNNGILNIDEDGSTLAFTDGLLILRYLMGTFQGDALTSGAAQPGGNRTDSDEVKGYLDSLRCK